ncbi:MAG: glycosyltransferase [Rubricoccaceae bacterium]|nr:glycosyltransferase [Rubricoccaceae bacterium]
MTLAVVICTYNHAALLDGALAALAAQVSPSDARWSALVVDNNCTDDTAAVVARHQASGAIPGLRRVEERRQGLTPARLRGVRESDADWVVFVDDDCRLAPDWVRRAAAVAAAHPDAGAFGGRVVLDWERPPPDWVRRYGYAFAEQDHGEAPVEVGYLVGAGLAVRRDALDACGWTHRQYLGDRVGRRLVSGGDMEITLRLRGAGYPLWYAPDLVLRHAIPDARTSLPYLLAMQYGLGKSQQHVDALCWGGSYPGWVRASLGALARETAGVARQGLRALARRRAATDARLAWRFLLGRWAGWAALVARGPRGPALLGQAAPTS